MAIQTGELEVGTFLEDTCVDAAIQSEQEFGSIALLRPGMLLKLANFDVLGNISGIIDPFGFPLKLGNRWNSATQFSSKNLGKKRKQ